MRIPDDEQIRTYRSAAAYVLIFCVGLVLAHACDLEMNHGVPSPDAASSLE